MAYGWQGGDSGGFDIIALNNNKLKDYSNKRLLGGTVDSGSVSFIRVLEGSFC